MQSAVYAENDFLSEPRPQRAMKISFYPDRDKNKPGKEFGVGLKTIVEDEEGVRLRPHKTIVIEIKCGEEIASFDIPPSFARDIASSINFYCDTLEGEKATA